MSGGELFLQEVVERICNHAYQRERKKLKMIETAVTAAINRVQLVRCFDFCKLCKSLVETVKDFSVCAR